MCRSHPPVNVGKINYWRCFFVLQYYCYYKFGSICLAGGNQYKKNIDVDITDILKVFSIQINSFQILVKKSTFCVCPRS